MSERCPGPGAPSDRAAAELIARLLLERDAAQRALADQRYERFTADIRLAVTWLHRRADAMNDPHAQGILNSAALDLAEDLAAGRLRKGKARGEGYQALTCPADGSDVP